MGFQRAFLTISGWTAEYFGSYFSTFNYLFKVRETIEQQKQISNEIDKFYKEMEELDTQKNEEQDEMV